MRLDLERLVKKKSRKATAQQRLFEPEPAPASRPRWAPATLRPEDDPRSWKPVPFQRGDVIRHKQTGDLRVVLMTSHVGAGEPFAFLAPAEAPLNVVHIDGLRLWGWPAFAEWEKLDEVELAFEPKLRHHLRRRS